ncbi:hypothetical protein [Mesorhizobium sp. M1A.T.Ca.IN.004.03.1.1]|uniref:hypothetical protein n=1 Tax=Mesorhizobium sp. M1A.T.Ca.IN.004.03.1.1 TaxID=2496795 RepID=UPI0013E2DB70|nr:hypothetical protein [Mesorhizobium sp. M1A.T.Ca.IN.004.03.1.1]
MTQAATATLMDGNALAAVNDLDRACRCSEIDLLANEVVRYGIEENLAAELPSLHSPVPLPAYTKGHEARPT